MGFLSRGWTWFLDVFAGVLSMFGELIETLDLSRDD